MRWRREMRTRRRRKTSGKRRRFTNLPSLGRSASQRRCPVILPPWAHSPLRHTHDFRSNTNPPRWALSTRSQPTKAIRRALSREKHHHRSSSSQPQEECLTLPPLPPRRLAAPLSSRGELPLFIDWNLPSTEEAPHVAKYGGETSHNAGKSRTSEK